MIPLEYKLLTTFLVEHKNYPPALLNNCEFNRDFLQKGLIIDAERGNILKLSDVGEILRATHGTKLLSKQEIKSTYGAEMKWDIALDYIQDPLSAWNGPVSEKLRALLDYFDISSSLVFGHAVDVLDKEFEFKGKNDYKVWSDILEGLIQIYTREHFASGTSDYFNALKANPEKYILKTDQAVGDWLKKLRSSGKCLYLLTGSNIDFANFTASYALGPNWRDLFDYVISFGRKPSFFTMQRPFLRVKGLQEELGSEIALDEKLKPNSTYSQGNWSQLLESVKANFDCKSGEVRSLYVGDNLIQDIYTPKNCSGIDTVALSEEIFENDSCYEFNSTISSEFWGSYFSLQEKPTLWASVISKYSQLCVSHVDILAKVPPHEKISCDNGQRISPKLSL